MGLLFFLIVLLVALVITRILADVIKLRWYQNNQHIHHAAYSLFLLPIGWLLYEYGYAKYAEFVSAIAYAFIVSEVHLLITPKLVKYVRRLAHTTDSFLSR